MSAANELTRDERDQWIADITKLQNHPANSSQDHMTICGFFKTHMDFARHQVALKKRIQRWETPRSRPEPH